MIKRHLKKIQQSALIKNSTRKKLFKSIKIIFQKLAANSKIRTKDNPFHVNFNTVTGIIVNTKRKWNNWQKTWEKRKTITFADYTTVH